MRLDPAQMSVRWAVPEARQDVKRLPKGLRVIVVGWLAHACRTTEGTEPCVDRPDEPLDGCVKIRFGPGDDPTAVGPSPPRSSDPRWRIIAEDLPGEAPRRLLVWAVGLGHPPAGQRTPSVYALAGRRRTQRLMTDTDYRREVR